MSRRLTGFLQQIDSNKQQMLEWRDDSDMVLSFEQAKGKWETKAADAKAQQVTLNQLAEKIAKCQVSAPFFAHAVSALYDHTRLLQLPCTYFVLTHFCCRLLACCVSCVLFVSQENRQNLQTTLTESKQKLELLKRGLSTEPSHGQSASAIPASAPTAFPASASHAEPHRSSSAVTGTDVPMLPAYPTGPLLTVRQTQLTCRGAGAGEILA